MPIQKIRSKAGIRLRAASGERSKWENAVSISFNHAALLYSVLT